MSEFKIGDKIKNVYDDSTIYEIHSIYGEFLKLIGFENEIFHECYFELIKEKPFLKTVNS